ncbi:hypothetical protein HNY73_009200 [Argiope bruennichi]|uniref:Uncharacterized protein n=1 Tax=Argiope bruennichi TaxID=94029 RepID=A0A8T0F9R1_ARGBR|nr:hypothetical protein HNY73_009200 [Argiope bruennichi]
MSVTDIGCHLLHCSCSCRTSSLRKRAYCRWSSSSFWTFGCWKRIGCCRPSRCHCLYSENAINHVSPAAPIAAVAPLAYAAPVAAAAPLSIANGIIAGIGILANGLVGHGLAAPLAFGNGLLCAHYGFGVGRIGLGKAIL